MSYDLKFSKHGDTVQFTAPHDLRGGTYQMGGTQKAWLNITWNYSAYFRILFGDEGIRALYGKTAQQVALVITEALPKLSDAKVSQEPCGCHRSADCYWAITPENARKALQDLRSLAELSPPDAVLEGD